MMRCYFCNNERPGKELQEIVFWQKSGFACAAKLAQFCDAECRDAQQEVEDRNDATMREFTATCRQTSGRAYELRFMAHDVEEAGEKATNAVLAEGEFEWWRVASKGG